MTNTRGHDLVLCAALLAAVGFAGCDGSIGRYGTDPPKKNPNPQRTFELRVSIPRGLSVKLYARYATHQQGCYFTTSLIHRTEYYLMEPIHFRGPPERQIAEVPVDKYLPGHCNWYFFGVQFVPQPPQLRSPEFVALSLDSERIQYGLANWVPGPLQNREGRIDLWCRQQICTAWWQVVGAHFDPSRSAPDSDRADNTWTYILPHTKIVEVYFHNADDPQVRAAAETTTGIPSTPTLGDPNELVPPPDPRNSEAFDKAKAETMNKAIANCAQKGLLVHTIRETSDKGLYELQWECVK
jgi:hypothetical protein